MNSRLVFARTLLLPVVTYSFVRRFTMAQAANDAWKQAGYEIEWIKQVQNAALPKKGNAISHEYSRHLID